MLPCLQTLEEVCNLQRTIYAQRNFDLPFLQETRGIYLQPYSTNLTERCARNA
jgi:hypothetical protein